eukprot:gene12446-biopygen465
MDFHILQNQNRGCSKAPPAGRGDKEERREDPTQPHGSRPFALREFVEFYGEERARKYWARAKTGVKCPPATSPCRAAVAAAYVGRWLPLSTYA